MLRDRAAVLLGLLCLLPSALHAQAPVLRVLRGDSLVASLDINTLRELPSDTATVMLHGERHTVEGPRLLAVLQRAGIDDLVQQKGEKLARAIVAKGADDYRVAFAAADVDPTIHERRVILVLYEDGVAATSLRLAVPDDARGARSVRDLVEISVVALP